MKVVKRMENILSMDPQLHIIQLLTWVSIITPQTDFW